MYKILFVDDERNILEYLPFAIDWNSLGITQMYTASNAKEALRVVRKEKPDIAIVDVEMPEMDGLEFCREAQKIHPQIKFVILSAFDRFDYARRALVIGVKDYLLKPVDEEELLKLMRDLTEDLDKLRRNSKENQFRQMYALEKEARELLRELLNQKEPGIMLEEDFPILKEYENICMLMQWNRDTKECRESLKKCMDEKSLFIALENGFYAVLRKRDILESMEQRVDEIRQKLEREGFHVWTSYVRTRKEESATQAFARCFLGVERIFYQDCGKMSSRGKVEFGQIELTLPDLSEGLHMISENGNISEFQKSVYQAMDDAFARRAEPVKICGMIMDAFIMLKIYLTKYWQEDAMNIFRRLDIGTLLCCGSPENLYETVGLYLEELQFFVRQQKKNHGEDYIVRIAKEYTKEHYQEKDLSLKEVSDAAGISRTYFSKAFKEMTGEKYWDYLSAYRIEKAKELLRSTSLGQAEISERVGYGSEFHFSRKFKEIAGMSPNRFRRSRP